MSRARCEHIAGEQCKRLLAHDDEITRLGKANQNHKDLCDKWQALSIEQDKKVERLRDRLAKYGRHTPQCKGTTLEDGSTRPCDCGFE